MRIISLVVYLFLNLLSLKRILYKTFSSLLSNCPAVPKTPTGLEIHRQVEILNKPGDIDTFSPSHTWHYYILVTRLKTKSFNIKVVI